MLRFTIFTSTLSCNRSARWENSAWTTCFRKLVIVCCISETKSWKSLTEGLVLLLEGAVMFPRLSLLPLLTLQKHVENRRYLVLTQLLMSQNFHCLLCSFYFLFVHCHVPGRCGWSQEPSALTTAPQPCCVVVVYILYLAYRWDSYIMTCYLSCGTLGANLSSLWLCSADLRPLKW